MCLLQGNQLYLLQNKQIMLFLKGEMGRLAHTPPVKWQLTVVYCRHASIRPCVSLPRKMKGHVMSEPLSFKQILQQMKERNGSRREARDLTQQDIQARYQRKPRCLQLQTLCYSGLSLDCISTQYPEICQNESCRPATPRKKKLLQCLCTTWLRFLPQDNTLWQNFCFYRKWHK